MTIGEGSAAARAFVASVAREQQPLAAARTELVQQRLERVLSAMAAERVGTQHFASLTGYGHGDQGRAVVDRAAVCAAQHMARRVGLFGRRPASKWELHCTTKPINHWRRVVD